MSNWDAIPVRSTRPCVRLALLPLAFCISAAIAAHDTPINPDDPAYLRRQHVWFQAQDSSRQQQLRKLHADFQQEDPETQARLTRVMQNYNAWLSGLDPSVREQVISASSAQARYELVRSLRELEWVETLPKPYREEYAGLEGEARRQKILEWRNEEADQREEWAIAQRHWAENPGGKVPQMFLNENRTLVESFVSHLRENLLEFERRELDEAKASSEEFGNYIGYALRVFRLAERHPIVPYSKVGPKDFDSLPQSTRTFLLTNEPHFRKKGPLGGEDMKALKKIQGRWPEYSLELAAYCQRRGLTLPEPLGDCRRDQMPPEVIKFLDERLEPRLKTSQAGKAELEALSKLHGNWPEYPQRIVDLARKYAMPIPGWTLPPPPREFDVLRNGKVRPK